MREAGEVISERTLYVGNRNYSSWSLRTSLCLRQSGLDIPEVVIPLNTDAGREQLFRISPSRRVPVLHDGDEIIWDSLAIMGWLSENAPDRGLLPDEPAARHVARSVAAEMHAGFHPLRTALPMDMRSRHHGVAISDRVNGDIRRIIEIWEYCRRRFGGAGDYLFGAWCGADAIYAPVVSRFRTYGIELSGVAATYAQAVWNWPDMQDLLEEAEQEPWEIELQNLTADGPRGV